MISDREALPAGPPFPYVVVALFVLMMYVVLVATVPPNPYRSAVAIAAVFATGYCALALIVGGRVRLTPAEILAFSIGLSIVVTSLAALAVSLVGIPITDFAIIIIGLPIGFLAWFLRRSHGGPWSVLVATMRRTFDFSDYTRSEKAVAGALLGSIFVALVVLLSLSGIFLGPSLSPALSITGPDGTPASLPSSFVQGVPQSVNVSALGGANGGAFRLRIRLVPENATGNETFHQVPAGTPLQMDAFGEYVVSFSLKAKETWTQQFSISIDTSGAFELRFELLDPTSAVVAQNRLPVQVT